MFQDLSKAKWSEIHSGQSPSRTLVSSRLAKGGIKPNLHSPRIDVLILTVHIVASCSRSSNSLLPIIQTSRIPKNSAISFQFHICWQCISARPAYTCLHLQEKLQNMYQKWQNSPQVVVLVLWREILDVHNLGSSAGKRRCVASVLICSYRYQEQALMQPAAPMRNSTRLTRSLVQSTKLPPTVTSKLLVTWPASKAYESHRCPGNKNSALTLAVTLWVLLKKSENTTI